MRPTVFRKGAPGSVAPFAFAALGAVLLVAAGPARAGECPATRSDERVRVIHVYDGDTVKLADGRRLRLIGINTPELAREGEAGEPLARAARASLQDMLDGNNRTLQLQYGVQHDDHYGRLLAHAWLEDGDNVAARLLQQGLATALVVPPNTRSADCYQRLEDEARIARRGLWALPQYQAQDSTALPAGSTGFRLVRGRITAVRAAARSTWLDLEGPLRLHVSHKDSVHFPPGYLDGLAGRDIEARGWIKSGRDGLRMNIRHPAALTEITRTR